MFKNLSGIVVGNLLIFNFSRMVGKGNAVTIQSFGQLRICLYIFSFSQRDRLLIVAHETPPVFDKSIVPQDYPLAERKFKGLSF